MQPSHDSIQSLATLHCSRASMHARCHPVPHESGLAEQVRQVAEEAVARARRGDGPTLIEAETYRFRGHSLADPDELRDKEEKARWAVCASQHAMHAL